MCRVVCLQNRACCPVWSRSSLRAGAAAGTSPRVSLVSVAEGTCPPLDVQPFRGLCARLVSGEALGTAVRPCHGQVTATPAPAPGEGYFLGFAPSGVDLTVSPSSSSPSVLRLNNGLFICLVTTLFLAYRLETKNCVRLLVATLPSRPGWRLWGCVWLPLPPAAPPAPRSQALFTF